MLANLFIKYLSALTYWQTNFMIKEEKEKTTRDNFAVFNKFKKPF